MSGNTELIFEYSHCYTGSCCFVVPRACGGCLTGKTLSWASTVEELHSAATHWKKINPVQPTGNTSEGQGKLRVCNSCVWKTNQTTKPSLNPTKNKNPLTLQQGDLFCPPCTAVSKQNGVAIFQNDVDFVTLMALDCPLSHVVAFLHLLPATPLSSRSLGSWTDRVF